MKNILVTGASGFLGRALVDKLAKQSCNIIGIERDRDVRLNQQLDFAVFGDITDPNVSRRAIADYEVEEVFHFASQSIVRICANDPITAYQSNVMGTVNLLEACRTVGANTISKVVVSTSDKVYGHAPSPYTESTPFEPRYTYEATKACQDIVCTNYFHNYNVPVCPVRCSNIYGPGDPNASRLIPNTIKRLSQGLPAQIYTSVMNFKREFMYIDDIVDAFLTIASKGVPGEAYCVGGNGAHTVLEVVDAIRASFPDSPETDIIEKAANFKEIEEQWIDATKLRCLGWEAKWSLEQGLLATIPYYGVDSE